MESIANKIVQIILAVLNAILPFLNKPTQKQLPQITKKE